MSNVATDPGEDERRSDQQSPAWPRWVGVVVFLGCLATAGYTVVETFWG